MKLDDVNIVVYGHSHKYNEENYRGITFINPGSCGRRRFSLPLTMAIVKKDKDNISVEKIILEWSYEGIKFIAIIFMLQ